MVGGNLAIDSNTTGLRIINIYKNGAIYERTKIPSSAQSPNVRIEIPVSVVATDYLEIYYWQNSGTTQNVFNGATDGTFYAYFIGA